MTRIAAGTESMDVEDWVPSKIYLSVPLMWKILQFNTVADSHEMPTAGLLNSSLVPNPINGDDNENVTDWPSLSHPLNKNPMLMMFKRQFSRYCGRHTPTSPSACSLWIQICLV